ncbi:MAG: hypothetical protein WBD31_05280, partial [Rubripirellula sp.]
MKRDRLILQHAAAHEMTTFAALHKLFFEDKKEDAVKSNLRRLGNKQANLLVSEKIPGSKYVYYRLTKSGARTVSIRYEDKLTNLPVKYAMLWLTNLCDDGVTRGLCKPREHAELFKIGANRLPKVEFYIAEYEATAEQSEKVKL